MARPSIDPSLLAWQSRKILLRHRFAPHIVFAVIGVAVSVWVVALWPDDPISAPDVAAIVSVIALWFGSRKFLPVVAVVSSPERDPDSTYTQFTVDAPALALLAIATDVRGVLIQSVALVVLTRLLFRDDPGRFHPVRLLYFPLADAFGACVFVVLTRTLVDRSVAWAILLVGAVTASELYIQTLRDAVALVRRQPPDSGLLRDSIPLSLPCGVIVLAVAPLLPGRTVAETLLAFLLCAILSGGLALLARAVFLQRQASAGRQAVERLEQRRMSAPVDRAAAAIHDGPLQMLLARRLQLDAALDRGPNVEVDFHSAVAGIDDAITSLRRLARDLVTVDWHDGDLLDAIDGEVTEAASSLVGGVSLDMRLNPAELPPQVGPIVLAVIHEGLRNVVRHAQASTAAVRVERGDGHLVVAITDDGRGSSDHEQAAGGVGLALLAAAVGRASGQLAVRSAPGAGFAVEARLPLVGVDRRFPVLRPSTATPA